VVVPEANPDTPGPIGPEGPGPFGDEGNLGTQGGPGQGGPSGEGGPGGAGPGGAGDTSGEGPGGGADSGGGAGTGGGGADDGGYARGGRIGRTQSKIGGSWRNARRFAPGGSVPMYYPHGGPAVPPVSEKQARLNRIRAFERANWAQPV
jgi:hypothetical protein